MCVNHAAVKSQLTLSRTKILFAAFNKYGHMCVYRVSERKEEKRIHSLEGTFLCSVVVICSLGHLFRFTFLPSGKLHR